ncbi:aminoacyl-tRNA deacylase [Luteolibacter soli]|uniref:YbaK/EbsC family protein n=1 Tax=Luteolibacter soli TaxID=3135280 RepID=A0ABU9AYV3_9BACT
MLSKKLKAFLDARNVKYITITHSPAFTAAEIARNAHVPPDVLAKTVMVTLDGALAMAVVPSNRRLRLEELHDLAATDDVELAPEYLFKRRFPDCEPGAMPPFGNLYDMSTYVSPDLAAEGEIVFNAGSHIELIKMSWHDYERLVRPRVARLTV